MSQYEGKKTEFCEMCKGHWVLLEDMFPVTNWRSWWSRAPARNSTPKRERLPAVGPRIQKRNNYLELVAGPEPQQPGETDSMAWKTKPRFLQLKGERMQNLTTLGPAAFPATSCIVCAACSLGFTIVHLSPSFILENVVDAVAHLPDGAASFLRERIIPRWPFT